MADNLKQQIETERYKALSAIEEWLEFPVLILSFLWLVIIILEFAWKVNAYLETLAAIIWVIFILEFSLRFIIAPEKIKFLKSNWLIALSLFVPALRIFRVVRVLSIFRAAGTIRGIRLLNFFGSINRGIRALRNGMARRGFAYVILLTIIVTLAGAAGMQAFEHGLNQHAFKSYGDSLWWTAMIMTTLGSEFWPHSFEGRILCLFLSIYAISVFGYITAVLASFFVGRDAENEEGEVAGADEVKQLREEIIRLTEAVMRMKDG